MTPPKMIFIAAFGVTEKITFLKTGLGTAPGRNRTLPIVISPVHCTPRAGQRSRSNVKGDLNAENLGHVIHKISGIIS